MTFASLGLSEPLVRAVAELGYTLSDAELGDAFRKFKEIADKKKRVTVVDLGQIYNGPYCSFMQAMAGARVIKIERPDGGDTSRNVGERDPADGQGSTRARACGNIRHPGGSQGEPGPDH